MFGNKNIGVLKHPGYNEPVSTFLATYGSTIAAGATVVGTVKSIEASREQAAAQRKAQEAQGRAAEVTAHRERIAAVREARIRAGELMSGAGNAGVGFESSGVTGALGSIGSQLGSNIGYQNTMTGFAQAAGQANIQAANAASSAATWQAIGGLSNKILDAKGGWASVFGGNTIPQAAPIESR